MRKLWIATLLLAACSSNKTTVEDLPDAQPDAPATASDTGCQNCQQGDTSTSCVPQSCAQLAASCGSHDDGCGSTVMCGECAGGDMCTPSGVCETPSSEMRASVEQYGVTWTFDKPYPIGQFVTGDWWVVGPVTITSVSPAPTGERNGSMLNPVGKQAYDARAGEYDGAIGEAFPLQVQPDNSLVSAISHPDTPGCQQGGSDGWETYTGECQRGPIETQAVLTIVPSAQLEGTFRPAYAAPQKRYFHVDDVDFARLPKLTAPSSAPDANDVLRDFERPWIDHLDSWTMQHGCATLNMFCYGREIGNIVSRAAGFVLLDTPEQRDVAIRLVQLGIDNYGVLEAGGRWHSDGGHFNGRKFPIVFAGGLLGDAVMASPGATGVGNEDMMTYYGTDGTALWGRECDNCYLRNGCGYSGSCSNGAKDCRDSDGAIDGCGDYRNCCTSVTWVGEALAIKQLNLVDAWAHPPFFDYVDRWMSGDVPGGGGASPFIEDLWNTHR